MKTPRLLYPYESPDLFMGHNLRFARRLHSHRWLHGPYSPRQRWRLIDWLGLALCALLLVFSWLAR